MNRKPDLQKPTAGSRPPDLKRIMKATALFSSALALVGMTAAHAQVTTAPVGYVTVTVNANADAKVGISMQQASVYTASTTSVSIGEITVPATVPDITTEPHMVLVTSGTLEGNWYEVTGYTSTTIVVAEDLQAAGLVATDTVKVIPFWTLDNLFPSGGSFPASSDVFNPSAQLQIYSVSSVGINLVPSAAYLYHDGTQGPAGWYDVNDINGGTKGSIVLSPETFIQFRNQTAAAVNITIAGSVPVDVNSTTVVSRSGGAQDSTIFNPYPVDLLLNNSELVSDGAVSASSDVFNPTDTVYVFSSTPTSINPAPDIALLYHDGTQGPAGWYNVNDINGGEIGSTYNIPGGAALIVRKSAGADATATWSPPTPYSF